MLTLYANFKGGTGKSTVVFNMAIWQLAQGREVTVCDLDPQRTVSDVAMIRQEDGIEPALTVVHTLPTRAKAAKNGCEWLIDVGTSDMDAMRAAIKICDRIIIPVTPSQADIWSTQQFIDIVTDVRPKGKLPPIFAILNRADPHPKSRENAEAMAALKLLNGIKPVAAKMVQRLAFRRSFSEGLAVFELEPNGKAAEELKALARRLHK